MAHTTGNVARTGRGIVQVLVALAMIGALFSVAVPSAEAAAAAAVSPALDAFGFPAWYEDESGVRLDACLDASDPFCVIGPVPGVYDTAQPLSLPANFPDEFFYALTESDRIPTPGCNGTSPGRASVRLALEGAFVNGLPALNEQMVFGRVRVTVTSGLCPNQGYTFTHPYGAVTLTTDEAGAIRATVGTTDIGCGPVPPQTCDFSQALLSPSARTFLRWDPSVAPAAPAGYLGDPATPHQIVGAPFSVGGSPANFFAISTGGAEVARTELFTVAGRLAGPVVATPRAVDFGGQLLGAVSSPQTVQISNIGADPLTIGTVAVTGAEFAVGSDACTGAVLGRDQSCAVGVTFLPADTGPRTATLTVAHSGLRSPFSIALRGTGINPGQEPGITLAPTSLDFGTVRIRTESTPQGVTVTNDGTAPLQVQTVELIDVTGGTSGDRNAFRVATDLCTGATIDAGATCDLQLAFRPLTARPHLAALQVSGNTSGGPRQVQLTAVGSGGVAAVSTTLDPATGYPSWYQDEAGIRLGQCIDPADVNCIVLADDFFDPSAPLQGRPGFGNFPEEFFYFVADSDMIATPGCAGSPPGRAFVRAATEAAFAGLAPTDGEQITFGRIRIVVTSGLCPSSTYTFTHPYGQTVVTTDADGGVRRNAATTDVGCFPVAPQTCDFAQALASAVSGGYLSWDPAVAPAAPAGYLGDAATLHTVVGAPFTVPGETGPANYVRIDGPSAPDGPAVTIGQTALFTVMGKLAGPLVADPAVTDFAEQEIDTASADRTVTLTNEGGTPLSIAALDLGGVDAGDFAVTTDACTGQTLAPLTGACAVQVRFTPTATAARAATLVVTHTGRNNPLAVALRGIGTAPAGLPAVSTPAQIDFVDLHTGQSSATRDVVVSNLGGQADLVVGAVSVDDPTGFDVTNGCTVPVAPGGTCRIGVRFTPTAAGLRTSTLRIATNVPATPEATVALSGRGFAGAPAVGPVAADSGYPRYYQDDNGVRVESCLDAADPNCVVLADSSFDPAQPVTLPGNFPSESFFLLADSDPIPTPGCQGTTPGSATLRIALEAAFDGATPAPGDQLVFARLRAFVTSGLCPNASYTFTTPYGEIGPFLTDPAGGLARNAGTIDEGCGAAPCDFAGVLSASVVADGFVRWDPSVDPPAPAGYLGDARTPHPIVGSRFVPVGETEPANYFGITGPSASGLRTPLFTLAGRLAGPVLASTDALAFGDVAIGASSGAATVTLTNVQDELVGGFAAQISGVNADQFQLAAGGTCGTASIGRDETCTVAIAFAPTSAGPKTATLQIGHNGRRSPVLVTLAGQGTEPTVPAVSLSPTSIAFGNQDVGTQSSSRTVTLTNTGTGTLTVSSIGLAGANASQFTQTNSCSTVAPGASCPITVRFAPTTTGSKTAGLQVHSDAPGSPHSVSLTGTGTAPVMSVSPTSVDFGNVGVGGSATKSVQINNSGTSPLVISSLSVTGAPFSISGHSCGSPVAPGRSCRVNVTFRPTARVTSTGSLAIVGNAGSKAIPLRGTGK